ncbi:hypothetical protein TRV_07627 [Trichophyton verrucosum HKI 0517]|uniref:Uncharacterized protein n=1 Tax=Trichophyton verrucosum (strain HKI 0517) TaxID=663202 RepID=D4DKA6_TRIVH|nr:uncharacterized protein TRV_07627 [Trichophyton verrucosum HKI 0517]EFE37712.1 hypothetical protein TRV_07627 [Trichophyton verrucosum HKI 0517]
MAPIYSHYISLQRREIIQPPRHPNGPGGAVPVDERIDVRTFLLLFIGTVSIFILGVFYWKLGTFLRSFTRSRVTGGGRSAASHHVRAWYGWIPTMEYNYHKERWKEEFRWARKFMFRRSSHADYSWIWWDQDGEKSRQRAEDEGRLRRIPLRLMRYAVNGLRPSSHSQANPELGVPGVGRLSALRRHHSRRAMEYEDLNIPRRTDLRLSPPLRTRSKSFDNSGYGAGSEALPRPASRKTHSEGYYDGSRHVRFHSPATQPPNTKRRHGRSSILSMGNSMDETHGEKSLSWKYRAWGARMQCQTFGDTPGVLKGHAGRPGTALSFALKSMISSGSGSDIYQSHHYDTGTQPAPRLPNRPTPEIRRQIPRPGCRPGEDTLRIRKCRGIRRRPPLENCLSRPEVRLVDNLDRKLEWLSSEMDPGRKSFAFLLLHNHWLNRATWVVMDPSSRLTVQKKRIQSDPRVNKKAFGGKSNAVLPDLTPAPRARAVTPRIDSWRVAVNQARVSSGAKEIPKVELLEGSAEEAADNNVDPASWILKKPPQGHGMSNKQKQTYFEGPGGWSEKLEYWENVPRLYRVRRVVLQGKANRRCVVRTGKGIYHGVERAAREARRLSAQQYQKIRQLERSEKSGRGVVSLHHSLRSTLSRSAVSLQGADSPTLQPQSTTDPVSMHERDEG